MHNCFSQPTWLRSERGHISNKLKDIIPQRFCPSLGQSMLQAAACDGKNFLYKEWKYNPKKFSTAISRLK